MAPQLFDLTDLRDLSDGDEEFVREMVVIFTRETVQALAGLQTALATGDLQQIRHLSHKMKPSLMNLHVDSIREDILLLEKGGEGQVTDETIARVQKVCIVLEETLAQMDGLLKEA